MPNHSFPTQGLVGDYEILGEIARGGMGVVYRARQRSLNRIVALKVLLGGAFADDEGRRRLRTEASAAAHLQHPNIVAVHETGELFGQPYYSMDFIEGRTLAEVIRVSPLSPKRALSYLERIARAVHYAHQQGVLHRDLKPSNVLVDRSDEPRVADFGLAKRLDAAGGVTLTGSVLGSPAYMPPEQALGENTLIGPTSDVYSLGAVLYELVTGRPPFQGETPQAVMEQVKSVEPVPPSRLNSSVTTDLETICLKCLEKDPRQRYPSAGELADDLERCLKNEPILARPLSPPARLFRWMKRRPALASVWFLSVALALGSTFFAFHFARTRSEIKQAYDASQASAAEARAQLRSSLLAQAQARRRIPEPGRRFDSLKALAEAAQIRGGTDLRSEAAAALTLRDIRERKRFPVPVPEGLPLETHFLANDLGVFLSPPFNVESFHTRYLQLPSTNIVATLTVPNSARLRSVPTLTSSRRHFAARWTDDTTRIWDPTVQRWIFEARDRPWPGPTQSAGRVSDTDISPDGHFVALGRVGGGIVLHELSNGIRLREWTNGPLMNYVRFSPDGKTLCITSANKKYPPKLTLLEVPSLQVIRELPLPQVPYWPAWSPDGTRIAVGVDRSEIRVLRVADGGVDGLVHLGDQVPYMLEFHPCGDVVLSVGFNLGIRASNWRTGQTEWELSGVEMSLPGISTDGQRLLTTDAIDEVLEFEWSESQIFRSIAKPSTDAQAFSGSGSLDFSADGKWLAVSYDDEFHLRLAATGDDLAVVKLGTLNNQVTAQFLGTDWILICSHEKGLQKHRIATNAHHQVILESAHLIDSDLKFFLRDVSTDQQRVVLTCQATGWVKTFQREPSGEIRQLARWLIPGAYGAALSPSGAEVLINPDGLSGASRNTPLQIYDANSGTPKRTLSAPISADADWSADGRLAMTSNGGNQSHIWETRTWSNRPAVPSSLQGNATTFCLSADGTVAAIATESVISLVSTETGERLIDLTPPESSGHVNALRFSPDGTLLIALWHDARLHRWDISALRKELQTMGLNWK